jgi:hypothetical protein
VVVVAVDTRRLVKMCKESVQERKKKKGNVEALLDMFGNKKNVKIFFGYVSKTFIPYHVYNTIIDV